MNKKSRLLLASLPLLIFVTVLFFLWRGLAVNPEILPSALLGKPLPSFRLIDLLAPTYPLTEQSLQGQVTLLNVWATWCYACEKEHAMLMDIKNNYSIPIIGLAYKDNPETVQAFLKEQGNPYSHLGNDSRGQVAMDLGVYGTPETFVIDKKGTIVYRHIGVLDQQTWEKELLPLMRSLK